MAKYAVGDVVTLKPHQEIFEFNARLILYKELYTPYENMHLIISKIDKNNHYYFENVSIIVPEEWIADIIKQGKNSNIEITDGELSDLLFSQI